MSEYSLDEYSVEIYSKIMQESQYSGVNPEREFVRLCLEIMDDGGEFEEYEQIDDGVDGAERWRLDGYAITSDNTRLCCFISDFVNSDSPKNFVNTDVKRLVKKIDNFINLVLKKDIYTHLEPTSEIFVAAENIKQSFNLINKIEIFILTNKPASRRLSHLREESINGVQTFVQLWDISRLYQLEISGREREEMRIKFETPLPCLVTQESTDNTISCLVILDGSTLFEIFDKWQSRLLERNVRTYLQNRSKVNKGIIDTIKTEPEKFFAYNNGLTTTADSVEFSDSNQTHISELTNFQIVNGAQTTSSIYAAKVKQGADISQISVQMKLTIVEPQTVDRLVPQISRFANSQNAVNIADFSSNHEFHVEFEKMADRIAVPPQPGQSFNTYWFYERARGQYLNKQAYMTLAEKRKWQMSHPRNQMLTKTDLAKYENTFLMLPGLVSKGAQANFSEFAKQVQGKWDKDKAEFGEFYFKKVIVHAIIFKSLEKVIPKKEWYAGFRANIITYTLSYFSKWMKQNSVALDYTNLFKKQICPEILVNELSEVAKHIHEHLQSVEQNLTTYAKGAIAWQNISALDINFRDDLIAPYLISENKLIELNKGSTKQQKTDIGLIGEAKAVQLKPKHWADIKTYLANMEMLTHKSAGILQKAMQYEGAVLSMSNLQKKELVKLIHIYEKEKNIIDISS